MEETYKNITVMYDFFVCIREENKAQRYNTFLLNRHLIVVVSLFVFSTICAQYKKLYY